MSEFPGLKILCTGMPGCDRDPYIEKLLEECKRNGKSVYYYHLFDYIIEQAKNSGVELNKYNILDYFDANPENLVNFRGQAITTILKSIDTNEGTHIISSPNYFEWRGSNLNGLRKEDIDIISPDMIIIFIDDLARIKDRLLTDDQWQSHTFSYSEIAKWRRESIDSIWDYAYSKVPPIKSYLLAIEHDVKIFYDLIFNRDKQKIYLSYPITNTPDDIIKEEREFARDISEKFVVFDPLTIKDWNIVTKWKELKDKGENPETFTCEVEYKEGKKTYTCNYHEIELAIKDIRHQIVDRDYKLIETSHYVIVYHPKENISVGVVCEMVYAKRGGQMVFAYYPFEPSPFFEYYASRIFKQKEEFIKYLEKL